MKSAYATGIALTLASLMAFAPIANADRGHSHRGHGWHSGHKVIHVNARHGHHHSHRGHWHHGHHRGHAGWWWVVGSAWYFYPRVVYPYPDRYDATVVIQQPAANLPPPTQYWYFCESSQTYYPYVSTCAEGWKPVPATPQ